MELTQLINFYLRNEVSFLHCCSLVMFLTGCIVYFILLFIPATYGRYSSTGRFYSIAIPAKVAWFLQEVPAFLTSSLLVLFAQLEWIPRPYEASQLIVLFCFVVHYFQRSFIYPCLITGGKPTPLYAFLLAFVFCLGNGIMQARGALLLSDYPHNVVTYTRVCIGLFLYLFGLLTNIHSDCILQNLREPGETGYKIPKGGLFEYVSCANFFGEIMEWFGFAVASWSSVSFAFAFFTLANLAPRAFSHHRFYLEKFDDYPKNRKAVIPFLI